MFTKPIAILCAAATFGLSACDDPNRNETIGTGVATGAIGAIAASALGANAGWTVAAGAAAATAGALYARHKERGECAYHTGDGETVVVKECPAT